MEQPLLKKTEHHWSVVMGGIVGIGHTPQGLWEGAIKYFQWCRENPLYKNEVIRSGKRTGEVIQMPIDRPLSIRGLCLHLGITVEYLYDVSKSKEQNDFYFVVKNILDIIFTQNLEGAMIGIYSPVVAIKHLSLGSPDGDRKPNTTVQVNIIPSESQKLLSNESEIEIPEDKK